MTSRSFNIWIGLTVLVATCAMAVDPIAETRPVATTGLVTFRKLISADSFQSLGFTTLEEAQTKSALGDPVLVHTVTADSALTNLPGPVLKVIWPVVVGERTCGSITVSQTAAGWKASRFGMPNFTRQLVRARLYQAKLAHLPPAQVAAFEVPTLQLWMVGYVRDSYLMLAPLRDNPHLEIRSNEIQPAERVFERLRPALLRHPAIPR